MAGKILAVTLLLVLPTTLHAQWAVEAFLGSAVSAPSNLTIRQDGWPDISFTAHYATKPLKSSSAPYYGFRVVGVLFVSADLRGSIGWARVNVANGDADVPNYALHFLLGIGLGKPR